MTKCIQRIRDLFEYALYKFTLYFTVLIAILSLLNQHFREHGSRPWHGQQPTVVDKIKCVL